MPKRVLKPTIFRSIPWILFAVVLLPALFTTAVGILVLVFGDAPGFIALGILTISFAVFAVSGGFIALALVIRQNRLTRMQTEFIANVSHELRTPLASIRMYTETLRLGRVRSDQEREQCLQALQTESERLSALVEQLLTFRSADSGSSGQQPREVVAVEKLVREATGLYQARPDLAERLSVVIEPALPPVEVSPAGFQEALSNLLENALTHGGVGPLVVTARAQRAGVAVSVRDSGPGISDKEQKKIFDRFYRARSTTDGQAAGFGLGLSIVDRFARDHGGQVELESAPGQGAIFTIWLPASERSLTDPSGAGEQSGVAPEPRSA
jgi:two-component system phosphate regulon sensor histidine kinase PhoR